MSALAQGDLVEVDGRGDGLVMHVRPDGVEVFFPATGQMQGYDHGDPTVRSIPATPEAVAASTRPWQSVDLDAVLSGTWTPPEPTVGSRQDGVGLFYPGKVHTLASETEAGKTWFALAAAKDELEAGFSVVYIDFEDDEGGVVGRLLAMQVPIDTIREGFHYLRPTEALGTGIHHQDLAALLIEERPSLVILDGVTEAMTMHGLDPLDNSDVATFGRMLPRNIAQAGCAVVALDHVTKSRESRGRYAIGGVHKLNGLDGAAFVLENRTAFGVGREGKSTIKIAKDRPGQLRRRGVPSSEGMTWFADLVVTSHADTWAEVEIRTPTEERGDFRPTVLMTRIAEALTEHGELTSRRQVRTAVKGKDQDLLTALDCLILDGHVSPRPPYKLLRPYPEEA